MNEPQPAFIPAEVGDFAAFEKEPGVWVFGKVVQTTKSPPRVRKLLDSQGFEHVVGPKHHIRIGPVSKLDPEKIEYAWKYGPSIFTTWAEVAKLVVPCKRSQTDG